MTTITNTADRARDHVEQVAAHARATLPELSARVRKIVNGARKAEGRSVDAWLDRLGLQRRRRASRPAFWLAVGAVAAGIAMVLMSPTSGKELRRRIAIILGGKTETAAMHVTAVEQRGEPAAKCEASAVTNGAKLEPG